MPFTVVLRLAEHIDFPVRRPAAERHVAYWFRLGILRRSRLHVSHAENVRVFIAVLSSFGPCLVERARVELGLS
jgi:hypothetical protein